MSEYAPGTVAVATFCGEPGIRVSRYGHGWARLDNPDDFVNDSDAMGHFRVTDVRPLVVIDAEDREQVERLLSGYAGWDAAALAEYPNYVDDMQAALREFANPTPPKPAEPSGLGAVVEDAEGRRWVLSCGADCEDAPDGCAPWIEWGGDGATTWPELNAVRVLSEGVQP